MRTYALRHATRYRYARPVDLAAHLAHLVPRTLPHQEVAFCDIGMIPEPSWSEAGQDAFGNGVRWMFVEAPHAACSVTLEAAVAVRAPPVPRPRMTPAWGAVAAAAQDATPGGWEAGEFVFESPLVELAPEARDYAARSFPDGRPVLEALLDLNARIFRDVAFRPGVTTVNTKVRQVLAQRAGVCQDFTHLMIAGLRALGLPARYVSGYIRNAGGSEAFVGADQSHAWVGCWLGPELGWLDLDPTNGMVVADEHVVLGWGRDYADVSPVRGVLLGGGAHALEVSVSLRPA